MEGAEPSFPFVFASEKAVISKLSFPWSKLSLDYAWRHWWDGVIGGGMRAGCDLHGAIQWQR